MVCEPCIMALGLVRRHPTFFAVVRDTLSKGRALPMTFQNRFVLITGRELAVINNVQH